MALYNPYTKEDLARFEITESISYIQDQIKRGFSEIPNAMEGYREDIREAKKIGMNVGEFNKELLEIISQFKGRKLILS